MKRSQVIATVVVLVGTAAVAAPSSAAPVSGGAYCAVNLGSESFVCAASPAALASAQNQQSHTNATQYLIARLFDNANYDTSAGYLNVYSGGDCTVSTGNVDFSLSDLSTWSSRVSSFQSFGNCATRLSSGTNFTGSAYPSSGYQVAGAYLGSFNDKARSAQFS